MVIYPDVFPVQKFNEVDLNNCENTAKSKYMYKTSDICTECEYSEVVASLSLVKAMGAKLSSTLHRKVTHILCNITCDSIQWSCFLCQDIFLDINRGSALMETLIDMDEVWPLQVTLVSPDWIRKNWKG